MTRDQVIQLILQMKTLDQDYARSVLVRENQNHPEWNLYDAIKREITK